MAYLKYERDGHIYDAVMVHHPDHEGALTVERRTGAILTPIMERPEWAAGLAVALLSEHRDYYLRRAGTYAEPDLYDFTDLGWLAVDDETGGSLEVFAVEETRQARLAELLKIDPETGEVANALAEIEMSFDTERSPEEASAIEDAQDEGFEDIAKQA